jgi:predicted ribosomally synthesized peptide with nif11-like leader
MSKNVALSFIQKVDSDPEFHARFAAFSGNLPGMIEAAGQAGFAFSAEDFHAALAENIAADFGELSDAELDAISGGGGSGGTSLWGSLSSPDGTTMNSGVSSTGISGNSASGATTMTVIQ